MAFVHYFLGFLMHVLCVASFIMLSVKATEVKLSLCLLEQHNWDEGIRE